eukprot:g23632.t1
MCQPVSLLSILLSLSVDMLSVQFHAMGDEEFIVIRHRVVTEGLPATGPYPHFCINCKTVCANFEEMNDHYNSNRHCQIAAQWQGFIPKSKFQK